MGQTMNETPEEFLDMLKQAGVEIANERELRQRLAEAARWRYAFSTLVRNGRTIGIRFDAAAANKAAVHDAFIAFNVADYDEEALGENG